jgi:isochorismate hydrolase
MDPYVTEYNIKEKTDSWLNKVKPYNRSLKLNHSKAVLIVVDMQRFFTQKESDAFTEGAVAIIKTALE